MARSKIAITLDQNLLREIDRMVRQGTFPNRSQAIEQAVADKVERLKKTRLAREAAKLDPKEEVALAEEGLAEEIDLWPEY